MKKYFVAIIATGLLSWTLPAQAEPTKDDAQPVARIGHTVLTEKQMKDELGTNLYEAENNLYQLKKNWVDQHAKTLLFQQAATDAGMGVDQWRTKEIDSHVQPPSQSEVTQILQQFPANLRSSTDSIRQATEYLSQQKRNQKENEVYQQLLAKYPVEILVAKPIAPHIMVAYGPDDPVKGNKDAPVTILEFTDFQCPYCQRSQATLKQVETTYADKVKIVARQFPLPMHNRAKPASEAALCAREQGKYWEMRDKLFEKQQLEDADFRRYAQELKLDTKKFDQCLTEHRYASRVEQDISAGQSYGVRGTPHFFVNGQPISGAQPFDVFGRLIEALDAERLAVAAAYGVTVRTVRDHFHLSFAVPHGPVGDAGAILAARDANPGPASTETRYITEDVPFGLVPRTMLAHIAGVPMPLHEGGISIFSALYDRDFRAENDLLPVLVLDGLSMDALRRLVQG